MGEGGNTVGDSPVETSLERVEALLEAARYDDIDDLKSLESAGLSLDSKDLHGRTAWGSRGYLPVAVEVTKTLVEIQQKDPQFRKEQSMI
ncbi:hypothetical protein ACFX13_030913 [Malus domestica]